MRDQPALVHMMAARLATARVHRHVAARENVLLRHLEKIKIRALLVYGTVFCVAPRVTYNEYAPLGTP